MTKAPTAAARRPDTPDDDNLRALLELLREADEGREFDPDVRFTGANPATTCLTLCDNVLRHGAVG
ncbi:MAG: hypothetical protein M3Q65_08650 [Chloroflexota bacterium]|nr:hypothetical protein [Chloroflexota bacterium]